MVSRLIKVFARLIGKAPDRSQKIEPNYEIGSTSLDTGIRVQVRSNFKTIEAKKEYKNLVVGENSIVSGNFIFENGLGKVNIGDRSFIGGGDFICIKNIEIGDDVLISWGCTFIDTNSHSLDLDLRRNDVADWRRGLVEDKIGFYKDWEYVQSKPIKVKNGAWIGFKSIILKGVTIGEGAIIGSGSVVTTDIPDRCVAAGNPARVIKQL